MMLDSARRNFANDPDIELLEHDLDCSLPNMENFNAVICGFTIHQLSHERKRSIYNEIYDVLNPKGVFCNLDNGSSPCEKHTTPVSFCNRFYTSN